MMNTQIVDFLLSINVIGSNRMLNNVNSTRKYNSGYAFKGQAVVVSRLLKPYQSDLPQLFVPPLKLVSVPPQLSSETGNNQKKTK